MPLVNEATVSTVCMQNINKLGQISGPDFCVSAI